MTDPSRPTIALADLEPIRAQFADRDAALKALVAIEDCEGDLEDAAIDLAIRAGQQPDRGDDWLDGLAKRCRSVLCCRPELRAALDAGDWLAAFDGLVAADRCPSLLALPVLLYVRDRGVADFCRPLERPDPSDASA